MYYYVLVSRAVKSLVELHSERQERKYVDRAIRSVNPSPFSNLSLMIRGKEGKIVTFLKDREFKPPRQEYMNLSCNAITT